MEVGGRLSQAAFVEVGERALSLLERAVHEGKIRKSRGALFVAIVKRACADRGAVVGQAFSGAR
jgi:hypothetical protein